MHCLAVVLISGMQNVVPQEMICVLDPAKGGETKTMNDMEFKRNSKINWIGHSFVYETT